MKSVDCDILIAGGSLGGVAAALRAAEMGRTVCLLSPSKWIGGQMTSQGVNTPDEHQYIEMFGGTRLYYDFRERVRTHYRTRKGLSPVGARQPLLSTGDAWVNTGFGVEALVGLKILQEMLAPWEASGLLRIFYSTTVDSDGCEWTDAARTQIKTLTATQADGERFRFSALYFLDATDLGDLLEIVGAESVIGAESQNDTGEPDAKPDVHPEWIQAVTFPIAVQLNSDGSGKPIPEPENYEQLKEMQKYDYRDGSIDGEVSWVFTGVAPWWTYRRIITAGNFADGLFPRDIATINNDANDYQGGAIPAPDQETEERRLAEARQASLGYLYWMQTECPHDPDAPETRGYPQLQICPTFFNTPDGLSPDPYIRESRRLIARRRIVEQDIVDTFNPGARAAFFRDSCGVGMFGVDVHPSSPDMPRIDLDTKPFQIPVGSLIPIRITNLLAASKNLGVTHITNGAYRVHPTEWNIGESAAALAAFCIDRQLQPSMVPDHQALLRLFQMLLIKSGIPLYWWIDVPIEHPAFEATQMLGLEQIFLAVDDLHFRPEDLLKNRESIAVMTQAGITVQWPKAKITRAEAACYLANCLGLLT